jgi:hypothetical protein
MGSGRWFGFRSVFLYPIYSLLGGLLALGCEPVDDGAATRAKGWDGVLTDSVLPSDRPVYNTIDEDPMDVSADGCEKTASDAMKILEDNCASCHDKGTPAPDVLGCSGTTTFDFVLDPMKMQAQSWTRTGGQPPIKYLTAGDADASAIFLRAVIVRDMPPLQLCLEGGFYSRLDYSAVSVLRQWIDVCL